MSSEAAKKAYPDLERGDDERYDDFEVRETIMAYSRAAFDAGAVEALRQAADDPSLRLSGHSGISITRLRAMADEWVVGQ